MDVPTPSCGSPPFGKAAQGRWGTGTSDRHEGSGTGTLDDLIAGTERGPLVTSLWYIRLVDPQSLLLTGLTRDGVYLVEHGEITSARAGADTVS